MSFVNYPELNKFYNLFEENKKLNKNYNYVVIANNYKEISFCYSFDELENIRNVDCIYPYKYILKDKKILENLEVYKDDSNKFYILCNVIIADKNEKKSGIKIKIKKQKISNNNNDEEIEEEEEQLVKDYIHNYEASFLIDTGATINYLYINKKDYEKYDKIIYKTNNKVKSGLYGQNDCHQTFCSISLTNKINYDDKEKSIKNTITGSKLQKK